jgi:hypothetical protein
MVAAMAGMQNKLGPGLRRGDEGIADQNGVGAGIQQERGSRLYMKHKEA